VDFRPVLGPALWGIFLAFALERGVYEAVRGVRARGGPSKEEVSPPSRSLPWTSRVGGAERNGVLGLTGSFSNTSPVGSLNGSPSPASRMNIARTCVVLSRANLYGKKGPIRAEEELRYSLGI